MTSSKRKLILFQPPKFSKEVYNELSVAHWDVLVANDLQQASELFSKHSFNVGLCLIENCNNTLLLTQLSRLIKLSGGTHWILGLPKQCPIGTSPNPTLSKLVSEHCYGTITLPVDKADLFFTLGHALCMNELTDPYPTPTNEMSSNLGIMGKSPVMATLFRQLKKVCSEDCSVLLTGETGTGKELVANAIHNHSSRAGKPLIAVNCGAFPKDLIQAELFGYEKGAFTGALQCKIGLIESAQEGTLFLDEVGDLPYEQQGNLLRFLEDRTIMRVGGSANIPINVRIIAATHVDLKKAVQQGEFREDLYYRLRVLQVETPPLREREEDIELLARYFFKKFADTKKHSAKGFSADALHLLKHYDWPGNVRELMHCIHSAVIMTEDRLISPVDLGLEKRNKGRTLKTLEEARAVADCESITNILHHTNFNMSRAAEVLGITRVSLYRLVDKYQLRA